MKTIARVLGVIVSIVGVICSFVLSSYFGFAYAIAGIFVTLVQAFILFALGEILDYLFCININTSNSKKQLNEIADTLEELKKN